MQVIVNKLLTTYAEAGNGDKIILFIHGWADSGKTFDALINEIIGGGNNYKAVTPDLPGFGGSQAPNEAWGLSDYAIFLNAFIQKLNFQPVAIVGHSNGGAIAIHGLAHKIFDTSNLVLIGSAGIRDKSVKKEAMRLLAKPAKIAIKITPKQTQKQIRQKLYAAVGSDYLIAEHMQETFKKVVTYDVRNEAADVTAPTCLIYGAKDTSTPPAYGELLASKFPRATMHTIPLAGHFVHQEQATKVARICRDFLDDKVIS